MCMPNDIDIIESSVEPSEIEVSRYEISGTLVLVKAPRMEHAYCNNTVWTVETFEYEPKTNYEGKSTYTVYTARNIKEFTFYE